MRHYKNDERLTQPTEMISHTTDGLFHFVFDKTHDLSNRDIIFMYDFIMNNYLRYPNVCHSTPDFPAMNTLLHLKSLKKVEDFIGAYLDNDYSDMVKYNRIVERLSDILDLADTLRFQDFVLYSYYGENEVKSLEDFCSLDKWATTIEDILDIQYDKQRKEN